jgi:hypothetical protein
MLEAPEQLLARLEVRIIQARDDNENASVKSPDTFLPLAFLSWLFALSWPLF